MIWANSMNDSLGGNFENQVASTKNMFQAHHLHMFYPATWGRRIQQLVGSRTKTIFELVVGPVIVAIGMGLVNWAELINCFFSGAVRIQADGGQRVISAGPYTAVRHPAHAGGTLALIAGGLALNSLVSIIPAVLIALPVIVYQRMIEDQMLRNEMVGYADYARKSGTD